MLPLKRATMQTLKSGLIPPIREATGCRFLETYHEVCGRPRVGMSEVDGVHTEGLLQLVLVLHPVGFQADIRGG